VVGSFLTGFAGGRYQIILCRKGCLQPDKFDMPAEFELGKAREGCEK